MTDKPIHVGGGPSLAKHISRRRFIRRLIGTTLVVAGVMSYGHEVGGNELEVNRSRIQVPRWPAGATPLKIGFLSDFHCDSDAAVERAHRSVEMLLGEEPDIVLLGGDFITRSAQKWTAPMAHAIAATAKAPFGAIGVLGNHDWWSGRQDEICRQLSAVGIRILRNQSVLIPKANVPIWLVGVDDMTVHQANGERALSSVPADAAVKIALVHEPDWADSAPANAHFALQLSGHSHAGQVRVFGQPIHCPPLGCKYPQGLEQSPTHPVYTTRGVGMMCPQIRIDCPPEVTLITLCG